MPELPEVETVRRTLELAIKNEVIDDVIIKYSKIIQHDLDDFSNQIKNQRIHEIRRKGKYLIFVLDQHVMIIHLRMEGKFFIKETEPFDKHEHVIFKFKSHKELRYHDVRKFGTIHLLDKMDYENVYPINQLGPEPKDIKLDTFYQTLKHKRIPIKSALLDQHIISGLGNIYVDETLFHARIYPTKLTCDLSKEDCKRIIEAATLVLEKAVKLGGSTIRSYTSSLGVHGRFQNELMVHMRKSLPCPVCGTEIIKLKVGGRGTYVCPKCQT